jgi:hypothetical protein
MAKQVMLEAEVTAIGAAVRATTLERRTAVAGWMPGPNP